MRDDSGQGGTGMPGDFAKLGQQYWQAWGDALRAAAPGASQPGAQPWQQAMDWWSQLAQGGAPGHGPANDAARRFNTQAQLWFGQMQQVAAQFAGQPAAAADIASAWRRAMEGAGGNPFAELIGGMRGPGLQGFEQWHEAVSPYLDGLRSEAGAWLRMPAFGFTREHQEHWQALARAQAEYQQRNEAYNALMARATQDAYALFEQKLAACEEPGKQLQSARALFDLWVDAAEEAYAKIALSPEFRQVYGQLADAQMRLRAGIQRQVENSCAQVGMPTRSELDGAHRKIAELERQLRRLRDGADRGKASKASGRKAEKPKPVARKTTKKGAGKTAAKKSAASKSPGKSAGKRTSAPVKPAAAKRKR